MSNVMLHITAGKGPKECEWVVANLAAAFCKEAVKAGIACEPVEPLAGPCASVLLRISGDAAEAFASVRTGTVRWFGTSTYRPTHKRKNWFVGVGLVPESGLAADVNERDITYKTMRASGPGGQHVNKTESAVRATHVPTGLTVVSQEQRSQRANRNVARLKLSLLLDERHQRKLAEGKSAMWARNQLLERGNAIRTYEGLPFKIQS